MAFNILLVWKKLPSLRLSGFYMLPRQFFFVYPPQHLRSGITFPIITQAVFVLVYLCDKTTLGRQDLISTPSISEALSIPKPSVVKILKALNRSGITGSGIGKKGGVSVLKAPEEIRLLDVFWAIEGNKPLFRSDHRFAQEGGRSQEVQSGLTEILGKVDQSFQDHMAQHTIAELTRKPNF
jgi:Rrf2 family protein